MLNFSRKGTRASGGVSQITIPSRYRSLFAAPAAFDGVCATTLPPSAAGGAVGSGAADCPEAETVTNRTDTNATATLTSFTEDSLSFWRASAVDAEGSSGRSLHASASEEPPQLAENDREGEAGFARFLVLAVHVPGGLGQSHNRGVEVDA